MSSKAATAKPMERHEEPVHPPIVRVTHWINALAMIIMIGSGWRIYNDSALITGFYFPDWFTLGGYAFAMLGRLPRVGDRVTYPGGELEIVALDGRRVAALRVHRRAEAAPEPNFLPK